MINSEEIKKFNAKIVDWWNISGSEKLLHLMSDCRMDFLNKWILKHKNKSQDKSNISVLDFGCGVGVFSEHLIKEGYTNLTALDPAEQCILEAKRHSSYMKTPPKYCLLQNFTESEKFDVIVSLDVVEHVESVDEYVDKLTSFAKEDTLIMLSTVNRTFLSYILCIFLAEIFGYVSKNLHSWSKFVTPEELEASFSKKGFKKIDAQGLAFQPLRCGFKFTDSLATQYFIMFSKQ